MTQALVRWIISTAFGLAALVATLASADTADVISLASDKSEYNVGDHPVFTVTAKQDCSLTLVAIDAEGSGTVLYPNGLQQNNRTKAGTFKYRLHQCGDERIFAICQAAQSGIDGITHDFSRSVITPVLINTFQRCVSANKDVVAEIRFKVSPPLPPDPSR
jgi:hypothetical protein